MIPIIIIVLQKGILKKGGVQYLEDEQNVEFYKSLRTIVTCFRFKHFEIIFEFCLKLKELLNTYPYMRK